MARTTIGATLKFRIPEVRPARLDRILVIEHDEFLQRILYRLFSSEGYEVDVVSTGIRGLEMLRGNSPSAVILDLPFPESSGSELCRQIASLISDLPFLILAASSDGADKDLILEMGAHDYVTIPFSPKELLERLRALMRRPSPVPHEDMFVSEPVWA